MVLNIFDLLTEVLVNDEYKPITRKHERKLIKRAQAGVAAQAKLADKKSKKLLAIIAKGIEARNELLSVHHGWIASRAQYWYSKYPLVEYGDYYSEAVLGMCKAIESYDLDRDIRLTTYSWWVMNTTIRRSLRKNHLIRPKIDDSSKPLKVISFSTPFADSDGKIGDTISDQKAVDPSYRTLFKEEWTSLENAANTILDDRQRSILYRKLEGGTTDEIARSMRVTTSWVNQIYNRALHKLTAYFEDAKAC